MKISVVLLLYMYNVMKYSGREGNRYSVCSWCSALGMLLHNSLTGILDKEKGYTCKMHCHGNLSYVVTINVLISIVVKFLDR